MTELVDRMDSRRSAARSKSPDHYLIAYSDGGARGNPGPAGYGVVVQDESGKKVAALSEYLGHQTNNVAEYQGLIAALEYATTNGEKALQVVSDSELLVRQVKGIYKVKNLALQELHARAKNLIGKLEWFSIEHVLRGHNQQADELANAAMDKGVGRGASVARVPSPEDSATLTTLRREFNGIVRDGKIELTGGQLPEGTRVQVRVKD